MSKSVLARDLETVRAIVLPLEALPVSVFFNIGEALEESDVIRTVDLVNLQEAGDKLRKRAVEEGISWTE